MARAAGFRRNLRVYETPVQASQLLIHRLGVHFASRVAADALFTLARQVWPLFLVCGTRGGGASGSPRVPRGVDATIHQHAKTTRRPAHSTRPLNQHGSVLGATGWSTVVHALSALFDAHLVPESMLELEDFAVQRRRLAWNSVAKPVARKDSNSFFGAFSAYLYAEAETPEELNTVTPAYNLALSCVQQFRLPELASESRCVTVASD